MNGDGATSSQAAASAPSGTRGRQITAMVSIGSRARPVTVALKAVPGSPELVRLILRQATELRCEALVRADDLRRVALVFNGGDGRG